MGVKAGMSLDSFLKGLLEKSFLSTAKLCVVVNMLLRRIVSVCVGISSWPGRLSGLAGMLRRDQHPAAEHL